MVRIHAREVCGYIMYSFLREWVLAPEKGPLMLDVSISLYLSSSGSSFHWLTEDDKYKLIETSSMSAWALFRATITLSRKNTWCITANFSRSKLILIHHSNWQHIVKFIVWLNFKLPFHFLMIPVLLSPFHIQFSFEFLLRDPHITNTAFHCMGPLHLSLNMILSHSHYIMTRITVWNLIPIYCIIYCHLIYTVLPCSFVFCWKWNKVELNLMLSCFNRYFKEWSTAF